MANNAQAKNKVCLIVIDGWGISESTHGNAIANGNTPVMDRLCAGNCANIEAHGLHVGLPEGLMGNSEVGHLNIGAGRVIYQDIVRINMTVKNVTDNIFHENETFKKLADKVKQGNGRLHLCGLVSDGGVHSHIKHCEALIYALEKLQVPEVYLHFFGDGRDTSPTSGVGFLETALNFTDGKGYAKLATIVGRYYAMDRDNRWERIRVAYDAMIEGIGEQVAIDKVVDAVNERYKAGETDEFLKPLVICKEGRVRDGDSLLFFNYRADRMREITECFGLERYKDLGSDVKHPENLTVVGMTQYKDTFGFDTLFPPVHHTNVLAEWLAANKFSQFHCAETEKYAHVTFFFNGGLETQFENEVRCMVPSPKVPTYDLQPEMSSAGVADKMIEQIQAGTHPFIMCNFAPPDMVGHTGVYEAAIKACEATDIAIGRIEEACKQHGYILMVTADHGNAEKMIAPDGGKHTAHTCYPVPFTCSSDKFVLKKSLPDRPPALRDVASTVLHILGLSIPKEMDGVSLA
ncbi:hypothetical protein FO519_000570 [Halicephalobus sp. NKZ332]|nr:hypothetical protein FO519_000570 [Halicephalobus sp. NKZ332]